jgi:hypothetical protein
LYGLHNNVDFLKRFEFFNKAFSSDCSDGVLKTTISSDRRGFIVVSQMRKKNIDKL